MDLEPVSHEKCASPTKEQLTEKPKTSLDKIMKEIDEFLDNNKEFENSIYEQPTETKILTEENLIENASRGVKGQIKVSKRKRNEKDLSVDVFSCEDCDYTATTKMGVYQHVQSKHEGVCYTCDQCEYKATQKGNLKTHVKAKHEEAQYQCRECEHKYGTKNCLDDHIQSKHEGIRYSCDHCEYKATRKYSLKIHVKAKHRL